MTAKRRLDVISRLAKRDGYRCAYCLKPLGEKKHGRPPTLDHVVPRVHGGRVKSLRNLCLACQFCNQAKGSRLDWLPLAKVDGVARPVVPHWLAESPARVAA